MRLRMFILSAYVSCYDHYVRTIPRYRDAANMTFVLTMDFSLRTSSSCATTLLLRPFFFLWISVLSSPLITLSITSLSNATLFPYASTAPYGSSFVESNFTASLANSKAFVSARRDDGRGSEVRGSGGDNSKRSGTISFVVGERAPERSIDRGGESERLSTEDDALDA